MKQFNLEEYLRLKEEGKEPRIVTRNGMSVRIVCTNRKHSDGCVLALIDNCGIETITSHYENGGFFPNEKNDKDLFFADLEEEPTYRPYKDEREAYQETLKHNSWYIDEHGRFCHVDIISAERFDYRHFHDVLVLGWVWADDNTPCGVREGDVKRVLELEDGRTIEV